MALTPPIGTMSLILILVALVPQRIQIKRPTLIFIEDSKSVFLWISTYPQQP